MIKPTTTDFLIAVTSHISAVVTLGQIIRGGITESKVIRNFKDFDTYCQTDFLKGYMTLHKL